MEISERTYSNTHSLQTTASAPLVKPTKGIKPLKKGNTKLGKHVYTWSLPPIVTCNASEWCLKFCYAQKGWFRTSHLKNFLDHNLKLSKTTSDFEFLVNKQLSAVKKDALVRIHVSGDFYSEEYIQKWIRIVKQNPDKKFLAFTKSTQFKKLLEDLNSLKNMVVLESLDDTISTSYLNTRKAIIQNSLWDDHNEETQRMCENKCSECEYSCWDKVSTQNVILPVH